MEVVNFTPETLAQFIDLAGSDWISEQLNKYSEFRSSHSPQGIWSHRPPSMSPIVPLVYWSSQEPYELTLQPFLGYWWGDPKIILSRLVAQINDFQSYINNLPGDKGLKNLQWFFRTPSRFASFEHEVRTASTFFMRTPYQVEPKFFNPTSKKGEPDIILRKSGQTFNVQCKSMDPSVSSSMSFDLFNYMMGYMARISQDFDIHSFLTVNIENNANPINRKDIDNILSQIKESLISKSSLIGQISFSKGSFKFHKEPSLKRQASHLSDNLGVWMKDRLFHERRALPSKTNSSYKLTVECNVLGGKYPSFEHFVYPRLEQSAREAPKTNPLIICLHVYLPLDIHSYIKSFRIQGKVLPDLNDFFDRHRHVCLVYISSFAQKPALVGETGFAVGTPAWEVESQHWTGERPDYYPTDISQIFESDTQ